MAPSEYSFQTAPQSTVPDTGGNALLNTATFYEWNDFRRKIIISNTPSSGIDMYVRFNAPSATAASLSNWDAILVSGSEPNWITNPDGALIKSVSIFFTAAGTLGTNFSIKGW